MAKGGKRPGAGRPKGRKDDTTLSKEAHREIARGLIAPHLSSMIEAQVKHAKGLSYLVARQKNTGKFEKLTADEAEALLAGEESDRVVVEVWEKDPSVQAFTDLANRLMDKPKEQEAELAVKGNLIIKWQK